MFGTTWDKRYELAKAYYEKNGNLDVPFPFFTSDGYTYDENGYNLGRWIRYQRSIYDELPDEEKNKLIQIGFVVNVHDKTWNEYYSLLLKYYKHFGGTNVPIEFITKNGYKYDKKGLPLGRWTYSQRSNFDKLSDDRKDKLIVLGFTKDLREEEWNSHYELARQFYLYYGHLRIPQTFRTLDGITNNTAGFSLGRWLFVMRQRYDKLSDERKVKLAGIGFALSSQENVWNEKFAMAQVYYEHNLNLKIPQSFKTFNGYDYHADGIRLGGWLFNQRDKFDRLSLDKQNRLFGHGMILDVPNNTKEVRSLASANSINSLFNRKLLDVISFQELQAKINYLKSIGLEISNESNLNEVFFMNSHDLEEKCGLSIHDMITNYSDGLDSVKKLIRKHK